MMKPWLEKQLGRIPGRGGLAEAIRYALSRWTALCRFLDDGRIDLDPVERATGRIRRRLEIHERISTTGGTSGGPLIDLTSAEVLRVIPTRRLSDSLGIFESLTT